MLIWRDVGSQQPDIFLSIGTGKNGNEEEDADLSGSRLGKGRIRKEELPPNPNVPLKNIRMFSTFTGQLLNTVSSRFDSILNCTKIWNDFRVDVIGDPYHTDRQRYIRLNPDLGFKVPRLDAKDQLEDIQHTVHQKAHMIPRIKEVAHRLVASTFFYEKADAMTGEKEGQFESHGNQSFSVN